LATAWTEAKQREEETARARAEHDACYIGTESRKNVIKLTVSMRQRVWFDGVWDKSKSFDLPVSFTPVFRP
jgi:hypothetical protein